MLSTEMFPGLTLGPQRIGDCFYREREVSGHTAPFHPTCDAAGKALTPRLLAPPPVMNEPATKNTKDDVKMELENSSLWKQFTSVGTEMIITKKGRRMFPGLKLKLSGLNPSLRYILLLDIIPVDNSRYRFHGGGWKAVGRAEARLPDRVFIHPDSPATGSHWQSRTISFHHAKLTNNTLDSQGHIILHSLHRYQPRVHVVEARDVLCWGGGQQTFIFPETQFITVTAYQNNKTTELKINSNPFAKGFREDGMNSKKQRDARQKRKISALSETDIVNCDPCDTANLLSQPTSSSTDLQALALTSLSTLPNPSAQFRAENSSYADTLVSEQTLDINQAFMAPMMPDIGISMAAEIQKTSGNKEANNMNERSSSLVEPGYTSFADAQANSSYPSSFPVPPPHQSSPFSLPIPDNIDTHDPQTSISPIDYPSILASSPTLSSSSVTPSLQETTFTFPTPPPSNASSPQPLMSSSSNTSPADHYHTLPEMLPPHTPTAAPFPAQHHLSAHGEVAESDQQLLDQSSGSNSTSGQNSTLFVPNVPPTNIISALTPCQPLNNQSAAAILPPSLPPQNAAAPFGFTSISPHVQSLSFPNISSGHTHSTLHLQNLAPPAPPPSLPTAFPSSTFTHSSTSFPHTPFQPPSCLAMSSSYPQVISAAPPAAHPQTLPCAPATSLNSTSSSVDISTIPHFSTAAHYHTEMMLHHPSRHPQLDPAYTSSSSSPALYPTFPSYPLRLRQDPHSSLPISFRHLYRQQQHGHLHPQGSYLDMGSRALL